MFWSTARPRGGHFPAAKSRRPADAGARPQYPRGGEFEAEVEVDVEVEVEVDVEVDVEVEVEV